ncbi:hypothetical protein LSH36_362g03022 [Paralvinella palmiformis]|uniref:Uncharacterized protein n=1 Tax=Paralvinella palmiformis TaxID=53620 RepID=A0AAD9JEG3_9ANNE|nr:hypothetical protein LSH36_362g03022 [Paralvinella palmiformis]
MHIGELELGAKRRIEINPKIGAFSLSPSLSLSASQQLILTLGEPRKKCVGCWMFGLISKRRQDINNQS